MVCISYHLIADYCFLTISLSRAWYSFFEHMAFEVCGGCICAEQRQRWVKAFDVYLFKAPGFLSITT